MASFEREVMNRLVRVESKLVRGFEVIYVSTLGRSLNVMLTDMGRNGATHIDKEYEIIHKGDVIGTVMFRPTY
jgi:hypothetical protein